METIYYKIADINIRIDSDLEFPFEYGGYNEYVTQPCIPDFHMHFHNVEGIIQFLSADLLLMKRLEWCDIFIDSSGKEYIFYIEGPCYIAVTFIVGNEGHFYYLGSLAIGLRIKRGIKLLSYMNIEKIFLKYNVMILHSCYIKYQDKAILFSAPSGTGKSTQGNLWNQYQNAEIINGDRTGLKYSSNEWIAYGLPMSGTSGIHKNVTSILGVIVILKQNVSNKIRRLLPKEAFHYLYPEITINNWNIKYIDKAIQLIEQLIEQTPVYLLECTKEESSVICLKQKLIDDGILE